jgi:chemotaxis protein MotB
MKYAFGVQNRLEVKDIPKGTSVIAKEFRPGRPEPTPIDVIMQQTIDITQQTLEFQKGESERAGGTQREEGDQTGGESPENSTQRNQNDESAEQKQQAQSPSEEQLDTVEQNLKRALAKEMNQGAIEIENLGQELVIRIREKGAFPKDSAFLQPKFRPLVRQIAELVKDVPGIVRISGHTDNRPLDSELYRSNWDLSAQRAVSVAQVMEKVPGFNHERMEVRGMADTKPIASNETAAGRARNRRVEISILQGKPLYSDEVPVVGQPKK